MSQKCKLNVEPIEELDIVGSSASINKAEEYIKDLEHEIDTLNKKNSISLLKIKELQTELKEALVIKVDIDYKIKYHQLLKTFHSTLEEFLPF